MPGATLSSSMLHTARHASRQNSIAVHGMFSLPLLKCPVIRTGGPCQKLMADFTHRSEDDLTHKLAEIIKANNKLKRQDQNGAPQHIIREFSQLLQFHITTYFDNTKPGQPVAAQVSATMRSAADAPAAGQSSSRNIDCCTHTIYFTGTGS